MKVELVLGAHVQFLLGGELQHPSLIDTGATIFAAAPRKFFPAGVLELARTPLSLSTVTSGSIEGGKYGAWSNVQMPICSEAGGEWVMCPRVFIYCAEVSDGLIFGYPFLEAFRLMVCPVSACLMPRECVSVHPERVLLNRGTEQVPFKGFVKNIQSVADLSGKLEAPVCLSHSGCMQGSAPGGAGPSCLSRATACAFVLLSLYFALLPLLFRVLVHQALSAESTAEKQENVNASQTNSGTVMVCVCSPKCTCYRECSKQHLQPSWHPPLEVGRKGIHTAAACGVCPCSRWRENFSAQASQLGSSVHASSTRNSVTPSHRPGSSICQHHEWLLQVALDEVDGQGGGELEVRASDLKIMRLSERAVLPTRGTPGAAGLDLSAAESLPPTERSGQGFGSTGVGAHPCRSGDRQCCSHQGGCCYASVVRALTTDKLGPLQDVSLPDDEVPFEVSMPTCVNAVPGYDSDFESQGLSDVESESCNEQPVPDCFAGGWGYNRDNDQNVVNSVHPEHHTPDTYIPPKGCEPSARHQVDTFPRMRRMRQFSFSPLQRRQSRKTAGVMWRRGKYSLTPSVFSSIVEWAGELPTVDVFGTAQTRQKSVRKFWGSRPFDRSWADHFVYVHPPFGKYRQVVEKILIDQARGLAIVPVAKTESWFWALGEIAVDWWDLPSDWKIFQDPSGRQFSQRGAYTTRVLLFDAHSSSEYAWGDTASGVDDDVSPAGERTARLQSVFVGSPGKTPINIRNRTIRSVIESDMEHPDCARYRELLEQEFADVFQFKAINQEDPDDLQLRGDYGVCHIELVEGATPKAVTPYRCVGVRAAAFKALIEKFKGRGMLRTAMEKNPQWVSRAFVVPKPGGKWRLVIDYRHLNSQIKDLHFPLPNIEDRLVEEGKNVLWTIFDLEDGFHQMPLSEESKKLTAFMTPWGVFEWEVLPMGLKTAPAAYQRMVDWCLSQDPDIRARPYIDDILEGTRGNEQGQIDGSVLHNHYESLRKIFTCLRKYKLTVKRDKCHMFMTRVKFCGHVLEAGTRRAAPSKTEPIDRWSWEHIRTPTQMKAFLGLTQWYSIYMPNYSHHAAILSDALAGMESNTRATKRKVQHRKIKWTEEMKEAFKAIKLLMRDSAVLQIPDPAKEFLIRTDASKSAVGASLEQADANGDYRPVAFFSRKLQGRDNLGQRAWSTREKETYALIGALQKFRAWIQSTVLVRCLTDHQALISWFREDLGTISGPVGRRGRWHEFLSQFKILVEYTPGKGHIVPDTLSRWAYPACEHAGDSTMQGSVEDAAGVAADEQASRQWEDQQLAADVLRRLREERAELGRLRSVRASFESYQAGQTECPPLKRDYGKCFLNLSPMTIQ